MTSLQELSLMNNHFKGSIPYSFGSWGSIRNLLLSFNYLSGAIPDIIGNMSSLIVLLIDNNELTGTIPATIGNMTALRIAWLWENHLSGSVPGEFSKIPNLAALDLATNLLYGSLPSDFGNFDNLEALVLARNMLTGPFTGAALNMRRLRSLDLDHNMFSGSIPLGNWNFILGFNLDYNMFSGSLASEFFQVNHACVFFVAGYNFITGTIPKTVAQSNGLTFWGMGHNLLSGTIPSQLIGLDLLAQLYMNDNHLSGSIGTNISQNIAQIYLESNLISGPIPENLLAFSNLEIFFVSSNMMTGTIDVLDNNTFIGSLSEIDLSYNQFVGVIPNQIFAFPKIQSFAATGNCLSGTLSPIICESRTLIFLALDGVGTGENCREYIFPSFRDTFSAFRVEKGLKGKIPACIFNTPTLTSIHLSGNRLTGSLPVEMDINPLLTEVALSHNFLSGSIPHALQMQPLNTLDLSFNRFGGTLLSAFTAPSVNATIDLKVNRLSGTIPSGLLHASSIDMLDGNIFACGVNQQSELPANDPESEVYACGSDDIDRAVFIWCGILFFLFVLVAFFFYQPSSQMTFLQRIVWSWYESFKVLTCVEDFSHPSCKLFVLWLKHSRLLFLTLAAFLIFVIIPTFTVLSTFASTYEYKFGWQVSPIFLAGSSAAWVQVGIFTALLLWFAFWIHYLTHHGLWKLIFPARKESMVEQERIRTHRNNAVNLSLTIVTIINMLSAFALDVAYVLAFIHGGYAVVIIVQVGTAILKIWWNEVAMWKVLQLSKAYFFSIQRNRQPSRSISSGREEKESSEDERSRQDSNVSFASSLQETALSRALRFTDREVIMVAFNILLNSVVAPCLAIGCVTTTCYYNALVAAGREEDQYSIRQCGVVVDELISKQPFCAVETTIYQSTSYYPPYSYSYQCSSMMSTNYAPVYVYMYLILGLILPPFRLCLRYFNFNSKTVLEAEATPWYSLLFHRCVAYLSTDQMRPLDQRHHQKVFTFVQREKLAVRLATALGVLLTFGVMYPPLGVIVSIAGVAQIVAEQCLVGSIILESRSSSRYSEAYDKLPGEVKGLMALFRRCAWMVLPFSSGMLSFLVFDTMGYTDGWKDAIAPTVLLMLLPIAIILLVTTAIWFLQPAVKVEEIQNAERPSEFIELDERWTLSHRPSLMTSLPIEMSVFSNKMGRSSPCPSPPPPDSSVLSEMSPGHPNSKRACHENGEVAIINPLMARSQIPTPPPSSSPSPPPIDNSPRSSSPSSV
eukprot:scaffold1672_cov155-Ochromonas_danica.AAC.7